MNYDEKKYLLKKLMNDTISDTERDRLSSSENVTAFMKDQWDRVPNTVKEDNPDGSAIWNAINKHISHRIIHKNYFFYRTYSMVASIVLVLGLAGILLYAINLKPADSTYIVSSGIRNMQTVTLPDGTVVNMGPKSKLTYPTEFKGNTREIYLDGQAFFTVAKNPERPFIVKTDNMEVQALGTAFELFSYDSEEDKEVILLNGKVRVGIDSDIESEKKDWIISPGEKLSWNEEKNRVDIQRVNADTYTDWRNHNMISFTNEKLSMILPRLEQWYQRKIQCPEDIAEKYRFTFKIKDETLKDVLTLIEASSSLIYEETIDKDYVLREN